MAPITKVVILNYNGAGVLSRFLPSVVANTPPGVEVIVADNGSSDDSRELLARDFPDVTQLHLPENFGFAEGYNRALRLLDQRQDVRQADHYILLNSDVQTPSGWLTPLVEVLENHSDVAAAAPKILSFSDPEKFEYAGASGGFLDRLGYPFCRGRILGTLEKDCGQYDDTREVMWASGACLAVRASAFRETGGLDGDFFAHQEEIDLCWRLWLAGHRVMVEPRSVVFHLGAGTLPPSPQKLYYNYRNNLAMLYKNLPASRLWWIVGMRLAINCASALVYLLCGKSKNFAAVWRAHRDFFRMRESLRQKRRKIQAARIASPQGIYRGWIVLDYLLGRRRFSEIRPGRIS